MDTSSDNIEDTRGAELETLIVALIHTLNKGNKKCGADVVFQVVSKSIDNEKNSKFFYEILETLAQKQKVEENCYANRTSVSIAKDGQTSKTKTNNKDNLKEDFIN